MSKKFDAEAYISRWDNRLIPIMLFFIFGSMVAAYALNIAVRPACSTHDYVFCGTPLDLGEEEGEHEHHGKEEAGTEHPNAEGNHQAPGHEASGEHEAHPH